MNYADIHPGWLASGQRSRRVRANWPAGEPPAETVPAAAAADFAGRFAGLSDRQRAILRVRAEGRSIREVGERLCIEATTAKNSLTAAYRALGLDTLPASAVAAAYLMGRMDAAQEREAVPR